MREFFTAFLGSVMFYVLFKPWMENLVNKRKWKKSRAAILIVIVSFFIIMLPIIAFSSLIFNKVAPFISHPEILKNYILGIQHKFNVIILSKKNIEEIQSYATGMVSNILNMGLTLFSSITMMYFFLYFLLVSVGRLEATIVLYLPFDKRKILLFGSELKAQTFSNAIGVPLIAVTQGISAFVAYYIAGVPEAAFWGILTGFASIIPIVGTGIIWVPICAYLFFAGNTWQGFAVLGWSALIMGSADNVIRFMLAKRMADVHPVITVLGVIMGLNYMGVPGLIFGPLLISYFVILVKIYYSTYRKHTVERSEKDATLHIGVPFIYQKKFTQKKQ
ncbi:AI-2E family transporter [Aurantibacillus circumpalustris]|uniref:AI-2E family transporter n=1 Tax=Aurantibacillus circumpalustris TaxID=3036359 RepID=UPI00295AB66F|nr:AI-2E family transporter [Aurantibacillus circumpalustris]